MKDNITYILYIKIKDEKTKVTEGNLSLFTLFRVLKGRSSNCR